MTSRLQTIVEFDETPAVAGVFLCAFEIVVLA